MKKKSQIIFLSRTENVSCITSHINNQTLVIPFSYDIRDVLDKKKIKYKIPYNYIYENSFNNLDEKSNLLIKNFMATSHSLRDELMYNGVSILHLLEYGFQGYLHSLFNDLEIIEEVIKKETPDIVYIEKKLNSPTKLFNSQENITNSVIALSEKYKYKINYIDVNTPSQNINIMIEIRNRIHKIQNYFRYFIIKTKIIYNNFIYRINSYLNNNKSNILFTISMKSSIQFINELTSNGNKLLMFGENLNYSHKILNKNILYKSMNNYSTANVNNDILNIELINKILNTLELDESMRYNDVKIWPFFRNHLQYLFENKIQQIINDIEKVNMLLYEENISNVIVPNGVSYFDRLITEISRINNIKSLVIQHGVIGQKFGFYPNSADKIAAWGELSKDKLINLGIKDEKIELTGNPNYDKYFNTSRIKESKKNDLHDYYGIEKNKKIVTYIDSATDFDKQFAGNYFLFLDDWIYHYSIIIDLIKKDPNCILIIKLHPGLTRKNKKLIKNLIFHKGVENVIIYKQHDIKPLLTISDVILTLHSSIIYEAMLYGIPIITIDFHKVKNSCRFPFKSEYDTGALLHINDLETLTKVFNNILYDEDYRSKILHGYKKIISKAIYRGSNSSSYNICNLIEDKINNKEYN